MKTLAGPGSSWKTSRRWTAAEARAAVEALRRSGEAVTRFAARHGIAPHRLYDARRQFATSMTSPTSSETPLFVEVRASAEEASGFEIVLVGGDVVRVPARFDGESLRRVLAAVRGLAPC